MRVPLEWLREMIDVQETPEELAELLTGVGLEVDAIERVAPGAGGVVAGRVLAVEPHPDAGSLWVCRVDAGPRAGTVTIVTGAPNVRAGMAVAVALPGAVLPGGMRVEARDLRGVTSTGMICSLHEMGLGDQPADREGIADLEEVLPGRVPAPGADLAGLLGWGEPVLVLSLTPNLAAHCQSILGVARELAAVTGRPLRGPAAGAVRPGRPGEAPGQGGAEPGRAVPGQAGEEPGRAVPGAAGHGTGEDLAASGGEAAARVRVVIEDPDGCALYVARVLEDVRPGGSPLWLRRRLVAVGMRPIDRIVDVTNYVMLELGQPLHAFDLEAVREGTIVVRPAREGERLVTLDGRERRLAAGDLVIADPERAIGLAGVMGGENSEVSASTRAVLLEAAWFDPRRVRVTARRHGLRTEAALRFEKGVDPAGVRAAAGRAMELLAAIGAGRPVPGRAEAVARKFQPRRLPWRPGRIRQWLGAELGDDTIAGLLGRLGFSVDRGAGTVTVPSYRTDIEGEVDLAEEVGRLYGYDRIPAILPPGRPAGDEVSPLLRLTWRVRETLAQAGLQEVVSWAFTRPAAWDALRLPPDHPWRRAIPLLHPLTEEHSLLRTTLLPGLLDVLAFNARRQQPGALVYDVSAVFRPAELPLRDLPDEPVLIGLAGYGEVGPLHWAEPPLPADFFTLKGVVEGLLERLGIGPDRCRWERAAEPWLHPGRAARLRVGDTDVGWLGELHPDVAAAWEMDARVVAAELDLRALASHALLIPSYRPVPRFPAVRRDIAVLAPVGLPAATIEERIRAEAGELLEDVRLFDVYRGEPVPPGQVSLAFALTYRAAGRTLTDEEVDALHARVRGALEGMGLTPRS